jgi:hypothetical protein
MKARRRLRRADDTQHYVDPRFQPKPSRPQEMVAADMAAFDALPQPIRDLLRDGKVSFPARAVYQDWLNKRRIWGNEADATRIILKTMKDRGA